MRPQLSFAEEVLLSLVDGQPGHDLAENTNLMPEELEYVERLRSCTIYCEAMGRWVALSNYTEVMGGQ